MAGFIDAEGCFHISIVKSKTVKSGKSVRVIFQISLHEKDKALLDPRGGVEVRDTPTRIKNFPGYADL